MNAGVSATSQIESDLTRSSHKDLASGAYLACSWLAPYLTHELFHSPEVIPTTGNELKTAW